MKLHLIRSMIILAVLLMGCSPDEVVRVGTPFTVEGTEGVEFHTDITDSEAISTLRAVIDQERTVEKPSGLAEVPQVFFTLDLPDENVSEMQRYVWYQKDGSALLSNESDKQDFFVLSEEQASELRSVLEK